MIRLTDVVKEYPNGTHALNGLTMEIQDGEVSMRKADCPDQICKNHKPICKSGETIVCLPHKAVIEISSEEDESEMDGITR